MSTETTAGRPTALTYENCKKAHKMKAEGMLAVEIAGKLGVSLRSMTRLLATPLDEINAPPPIVLQRTGKQPLSFRGMRVAEASGKHYNQKAGETAGDYWDVAIYELDRAEGDTETPPYAVAINYFKSVKNQKAEHFSAVLTDNPATPLTTYDPLAVLIGYPAGAFEKQQRQLEETSQRQYYSLVSNVLASFPEDAAHAVISTREGELTDIFAHLCHHERDGWTFTTAEASLIVDACEDTFLHQDGFMQLAGEIVNAITLNDLATKWHVDAEALTAKLRALTPCGLAALAVSIRTFWEHTDKPSGVALSLAGFKS